MTKYISLDPGQSKCGIILADSSLRLVLEGKVLKSDSVVDLIDFWIRKFSIKSILIGNGTTSKYWTTLIEPLAKVQLVDETGTTLRARHRYWELWPPNKLLFWMPISLMHPNTNLDAVAALVLLEDYLGMKLKWPNKPDFRILL